MSSLEERAREFASHHHAAIGQRRKYSGEPYIVHPAAVAEIVRSVAHTEEMLAAAWLHDTVEDTAATLAAVQEAFGAQVAALVEQLTDVSRPEDGQRAVRKAIDREHTARASPQAKTVKLADVIDNCRSIIEYAPGFGPIYMKEQRLLLAVLKEGDAALWTVADEILREYQYHPLKRR